MSTDIQCVVTFGETMALVRSTVPGPLAHSTALELGIGGSESNVAIGLARLGVPATWFGLVGDDSLGRLVERELRAEGVDVRIGHRPEPTGLMVKERRTPDRQTVSYYRSGSAGSRIDRGHLDADAIAAATVLHVTGITPALSPSARDAVEYAIDVAASNGVLVSFDLNYRSRLWNAADAGAFYRHVIPRCQIVIAGDDEATLAVGVGRDPEGLANALLELGADEAVIKLGSRGALAVRDGRVASWPAKPIVPHDTVGAGDAFVAGYLAEAIGGAPLEKRLETATVVAAHVCLVPGDWEGLPFRSELELLDANEAVTR